MTAILIAAILPFGTILTLPAGATGSYEVRFENPNKFSDFVYSVGGFFPPTVNGTVQFLREGDGGWIGSTLLTDSQGQLVRQSSDPVPFKFDSLWFPNGSPVSGWVRKMDGFAFGRYKEFVYPKEDALLLNVSRGTFFVKSHGSPSRGLKIVGSDNDVTVDVVQGDQSNLQQDLSGVYVKGDRNTLRGVIDGQMGGAFFDGDDNRALDLTVIMAGIGDDNSGVYVKGGSDGFRATNVTVWMPKARYPSKHGRNAFYIDNEASNAVLYNCAAYGPWDRGVFSHGGSNNRIDRFRSFGPKKAYEFAPFFKTPTKIPTGNVARSIVEAK